MPSRRSASSGFLVQVDDPFLTELYSYIPLSAAEGKRTAEKYVEALNHGLRGIPAEKVRYHTCYGINEGPRVHDEPLKDILKVVLKVNADAYSFKAANPRHEHEYHVWETVKLPAGKVIIPGVVTHASNIVEHPRVVRSPGRMMVLTEFGFDNLRSIVYASCCPTRVTRSFLGGDAPFRARPMVKTERRLPAHA